MKISKKQRLDFLRNGIATRPQWARRAVLVVFENQTQDEQQSEFTKFDNGIGFNGTDANICSSLAKQILNGRNLSQKQDAILMKIMKKYASQVLSATNLEILDRMIEDSLSIKERAIA
jgi:uncharacterized protein YjcR